MASSTDKIQDLEDKKEEIVNLLGIDVYYLAIAKEILILEESVMELGKIYATPNEFIQADWINENTTLDVKKRDSDDGSNNGSGYDLITTDAVLTIQSKLRSRVGAYLTNTRRMNKGGKNDTAANKAGQARYRIDEADVFLISKPIGLFEETGIEHYTNTNSWEYLAIPFLELQDPNEPEYLYERIPMAIYRKYAGRAVEVLESEYQKKKSINE